MSRTLPEEEIKKMLSNVSNEVAFRFFTAEGQSTNVTAMSLEDFSEKLGKVDVAAIDFHYPRGDFQNG